MVGVEEDTNFTLQKSITRDFLNRSHMPKRRAKLAIIENVYRAIRKFSSIGLYLFFSGSLTYFYLLQNYDPLYFFSKERGFWF